MNPRSDDILLELSDIRLSLSPRLGGSIMSLMIKNQSGQWASVLRSMPEGSGSASDAGSFVMLPWTNRVKDARFAVGAEEYLLESNANDGSAIHGVGRGLPWSIADRSPITARFVLDSRSFDTQGINYPFAFGAVLRYEVGPSHVEVDLSVTNLDTQPIPVGCGHHPYIHCHLFSDADDLAVQLSVAGRYPTQGCIPTGNSEYDSICEGFENGGPVGNPGLDDVFSGFGRSAIFDWPTSNIRMEMKCSSNLGHVVIYTPKEKNGQASEFVCVEPVSMVNDGFNRLNDSQPNTGVVILEPNETMRTRMTLSFGECPENLHP